MDQNFWNWFQQQVNSGAIKPSSQVMSAVNSGDYNTAQQLLQQDAGPFHHSTWYSLNQMYQQAASQGWKPSAQNLTPQQVQAQDQANQQSIQQNLAAFFQEMNKPLDPNDPYVQQVTRVAQSASGGAAEQAGIAGPAAATGATNAAVQAGTTLQMQRQQLGLGALQSLGQLQLQGSQFDWQKYMAGLNAQAARNTALLGAGLGIAGGAIGGSMYGAQGIGPGAQLGMGVGQSLGSATAPVPFSGGGGMSSYGGM